MDRVSNVNELQGWRVSSGEELRVIQGCLLKETKSGKRYTKIINVVSVVILVYCFSGVLNILKFLTESSKEREISDVVILILIMLGIIFIAISVTCNFIGRVKKQKDDKLYNAILTNGFRVNDVEVVDVISYRGPANSMGRNQAKVKDMYDNYCEENIVFECCNNYQKTKAILIDIPVIKNDTDIFSVRRVIPCKEYDPMLWSMGLNNYKKLINNKEA